MNDSAATASLFFQLVQTEDGFNMVPPEELLRFNNNFPHVNFTDILKIDN